MYFTFVGLSALHGGDIMWAYRKERILINMKKFSVVLAALVMSLTVFAGCGKEESVSLNGSTSMEKVVGVLSEKFQEDNKNIKVTYDPTGSGTGIEAVKNGTCDIGLSSRNLKSDETGLTATVVAKDGIAIIVNSQNNVSDLSVDKIAAVFTGEIKNWKELGGEDKEISCIGRENGSGTRDGFESVTGTSGKCELAEEQTSTGGVISAVSNNPNAIGYASLSAVEGQNGIKKITVAGVECTEDTVLSGKYAVSRPFVLVTKDGQKLSDGAQKFFDFATSSAASELIRSAGAVPVK